MKRQLRYLGSIFVIAFILSSMHYTTARAGLPANHEELAEVCLCMGPRSNGFNATGTQTNGNCARSQTGPFCFVDTMLMPIFWKVQIMRPSPAPDQRPPCDFELLPGGMENCELVCPEGKMVVSCSGQFLEASHVTYTRDIFPSQNGRGCNHKVINKHTADPLNIELKTFAICASPLP